MRILNTTVNLLNDCKEKLRKTYDEYTSYPFSDFVYKANISDELFQEARLVIFKLCEEMEREKPYSLTNCRSVEEFVDFLNFGDSPFRENMSYISNLFNPFIDYVEMKNINVQILHIKCEVPQELNYSHILEDINKCEERIDSGDYSGALTSARSLIEGVCKEIIYNIEGEEITGSPSLPEMFKTIRNYLNLDPSSESLQKPLKQVVSGLIQVVQGLNEIRNLSGDGHTRKLKPSMHHALLVVNSAKTVVNFLFNTYEYQRNLGKLKISNKK